MFILDGYYMTGSSISKILATLIHRCCKMTISNSRGTDGDRVMTDGDRVMSGKCCSIFLIY